MLTQYTRYALKALLHLAAHDRDHPVSVAEIAEKAAIPRKFLERILAEAQRQSFVIATRGKKGGYRLARPADQISFGEVIRAFHGTLALLPCVVDAGQPPCANCRTPQDCRLRRVMAHVRERGDRLLDSRSLASALDAGRPDMTIETLSF